MDAMFRKKIICFTGKLKNMTRNEACAKAVAAGFVPYNTITADYTDYLVMADPNSTSSKAKKAKKWGITVISEDEFIELCKLDKNKVEAEAEYKRTHKEKVVLDWATACRRLCKKLGVKCKSQSYVGNDYTTRMYQASITYTCRFNDRDYEATLFLSNSINATNNWMLYNYKAYSREEAYKDLVNVLFSRKASTARWYHRNEVQSMIDNKLHEICSTLPAARQFESPSELKLYLEIAGISIL